MSKLMAESVVEMIHGEFNNCYVANMTNNYMFADIHFCGSIDRYINLDFKRLAITGLYIPFVEYNSVSEYFNGIRMAVLNSNLKFPLNHCNGIPRVPHPGAFGVRRKFDVHTGIDLYCNDGDPVYAMFNGTLRRVEIFTGPQLGHTWWNKTSAMVIQHSNMHVLYGELDPIDELTSTINKGQLIGHVKAVLPENKLRHDIPGHSTAMLHLELWHDCNHDIETWKLYNDMRPQYLLDPTSIVIESMRSSGFQFPDLKI